MAHNFAFVNRTGVIVEATSNLEVSDDDSRHCSVRFVNKSTKLSQPLIKSFTGNLQTSNFLLKL